jgi:hypothetical protein
VSQFFRKKKGKVGIFEWKSMEEDRGIRVFCFKGHVAVDEVVLVRCIPAGALYRGYAVRLGLA